MIPQLPWIRDELGLGRFVGEKVRRERRWTPAGATPARELCAMNVFDV
jgi:hypothetical protein